MERFSRFRDAGTGIQVFLPPVPPIGSASAVTLLTFPFGVALGLLRFALLIIDILLWLILITIAGNFGRSICSALHAIFGRLFLFIVGFGWITTERISLLSRGRAKSSENSQVPFEPKKGDLILSNWSSWVDVLYITSRFNPIFIRPIVSKATSSQEQSQIGNATTRRKSAGKSQQTISSTPSNEQSATLLGWQEVNFAIMMLESGHCAASDSKVKFKSLEDILRSAPGPVVVFPELVTSNNRGLLRFESVFPHSWRSLYRATGAVRMGKGQSNIFIMSIKHEAPTSTSPSTTLSVPARPFSPLGHILRLCFSPSFYKLTVRLLSEQETPTHSSFIADVQGVTPQSSGQPIDTLTEKCADLMSSLSRLRRTELTWKDKQLFMQMYRKRSL